MFERAASRWSSTKMALALGSRISAGSGRGNRVREADHEVGVDAFSSTRVLALKVGARARIVIVIAVQVGVETPMTLGLFLLRRHAFQPIRS